MQQYQLINSISSAADAAAAGPLVLAPIEGPRINNATPDGIVHPAEHTLHEARGGHVDFSAQVSKYLYSPTADTARGFAVHM